MKSITLMSFLLLSIAGISNFDCSAAAAGFWGRPARIINIADSEDIAVNIATSDVDNFKKLMTIKGYRANDILSIGGTIMEYALAIRQGKIRSLQAHQEDRSRFFPELSQQERENFPVECEKELIPDTEIIDFLEKLQ